MQEPYSILTETRKIFKDQCRPSKPAQWLYNFSCPPLWLIVAILLGCESCFIPQYRDQYHLLRKGRIVWGCLIQANMKMFKAGAMNYPAVLIYSLDPIFDQYVCELGNIAEYLFSLKNKDLKHPEFSEVKVLADAITNERDSLFNYKIPLALSQNKQVYYTTFMFERKHLPRRYVTYKYFPILAAPEKTPAAMVLPSKYWAQTLKAMW